MMTDTHVRLAAAEKQSTTNSQLYAVRGSLVVASLEGLRHFAYYDRYLFALAPAWRERVVFCLASSWVPVEVASVHYAALDALAPVAGELVAMSDFVAARVAGAFLGSLVRNNRAQGQRASAWVPLREYSRMCERILQGGSITMQPRGENEALLVISRLPMLRFISFRQTMLALVRQAVGSFALRAFVRELASTGDVEEIRVQVRWL